MRPLETDSAMCSKWTVSPLISTPMAMMESNGPALAVDEELPGTGVELRPRPPRRSPEGAEEACICEAAKSLSPPPKQRQRVPRVVVGKEKKRKDTTTASETRTESRLVKRGMVYRWQATGSSQLPGTLWITMLDSLTPPSRSFFRAPSTRGVISDMFQRAWTMATRRAEPIKFCPLQPSIHPSIRPPAHAELSSPPLAFPHAGEVETHHPSSQLRQDP